MGYTADSTLREIDRIARRFWLYVETVNQQGAGDGAAYKRQRLWPLHVKDRKIGDASAATAHRFSWELAHGVVPNGLLIGSSMPEPVVCES